MLERAIAILKEFTEPGIEIKPESKLVADLGLTSFDVVNIVVAFEHEFDVEVPDRVISEFQTVQDIVDYIEKHV